jgi:nucleoside-diphosphate-sugar epimerase
MDDQFPHQVIAYAASKSMALDAAEDFVKKHHLGFSVVYLMPSFVFGPNKLSQTAADFTTGTNEMLFNLLVGKFTAPVLTVSVHIDDVANLHVQSLNSSIPAGRYILDSNGANRTDWSIALPLLKKYFPESIGTVFPENTELKTSDVTFDGTKAEKAFSVTFKGLEEQINDFVEYYLKLISRPGDSIAV